MKSDLERRAERLLQLDQKIKVKQHDLNVVEGYLRLIECNGSTSLKGGSDTHSPRFFTRKGEPLFDAWLARTHEYRDKLRDELSNLESQAGRT